MYTLRQNLPNGLEINFKLGNSYVLVKKEISPQIFQDDYLRLNNIKGTKEDIPEKVYALLSNEDGTEVHQLEDNIPSYILTENGILFDDISYSN
jgi:hypothetical protein